MNERQSFIVEDLDDNHLLIKAEMEYTVRRELEIEVSVSRILMLQRLMFVIQLEKNTYSLE